MTRGIEQSIHHAVQIGLNTHHHIETLREILMEIGNTPIEDIDDNFRTSLSTKIDYLINMLGSYFEAEQKGFDAGPVFRK